MSTRLGKRALQKQRTRAHLLEVAREQFAANGILATTTAQIAKAAGVSHGTVFTHFPTRDDLVAEVVSQAVGAVLRELHERMSEGLTVREILEAHLTALSHDEALNARLVMEAPLLPTEAKNRLTGIQSALSHHLAAAADTERRAGTLRCVAPHLLFNTWIGLVNHYLAHRDLFAPGASVLERKGPELVDHFLALLAP